MKLNKKIENNIKNYGFLKVKLKNINLDLEICEASTRENIEKLKKSIENEVKQIERALASLTNREKQIIELRYFKYMSWNEISNIIGLNSTHLMILRTETINKMEKYF